MPERFNMTHARTSGRTDKTTSRTSSSSTTRTRHGQQQSFRACSAEMLQQLLEEDHAQQEQANLERAVPPVPSDARSSAHEHATAARARAHHTQEHKRKTLCAQDETAVCWMCLVNVHRASLVVNVTYWYITKDRPLRTQPSFPISHIGGGAGCVPAREAGFDVPTHVPA